MKLKKPSGSTVNVQELREALAQIERADDENHKRARDVNIAPGRLILTAPNGTRYSITVSNAGTLSAVAI